MKKLFVLLFVPVFVYSAQFGVDLGWQKRWREGNLFSTGVILPKMGIGYMTTAFNFQANRKENCPIPDLSGTIEHKTHSYYGASAGYFLTMSPIFRPGAIVGFAWESDEKFINTQRIGYTDYKFTPYFGLDVHCWFLNFKVSNEGIGAGINFFLSKD
jgi:hypothetical protein